MSLFGRPEKGGLVVRPNKGGYSVDRESLFSCVVSPVETLEAATAVEETAEAGNLTELDPGVGPLESLDAGPGDRSVCWRPSWLVGSAGVPSVPDVAVVSGSTATAAALPHAAGSPGVPSAVCPLGG